MEKYKGYEIEYDPKPIPNRSADYTFTHEDYDGVDDLRIGYAESIKGAKADIDMIEEQ